MKPVMDWIWNGPWWAPFVGAIYISILVGIAFAPVIGAMRANKKQ